MLQWGHNRPHQVWQVGGGSGSLGTPSSAAPFLGGPGSSALNSAQMAPSQGKTPSACARDPAGTELPWPRGQALGASRTPALGLKDRIPGSTHRRVRPFGSKASLYPHDELET